LALDGGVSGQLQAPAALPQRKEFWYSLNRSLVGPQSFSGSFGEQKNLLTQERQMLNGINIDTALHSNMSHVVIFKNIADEKKSNLLLSVFRKYIQRLKVC
jgi:hypothetical protein